MASGDSYFQDSSHLCNCLLKIIRTSEQRIDLDSLLPITVYAEILLKKGLANKFTWALRDDISLLERGVFTDWCENNGSIRFVATPLSEGHYTLEFIGLMRELEKVMGIYSFWSDTKCLYVGMSVNLCSRVVTSFQARLQKYKQDIWIQVFRTKTASDMAVLEAVYIAKLKPILNTTGRFEDQLTINVDLPKLSEPILIKEPSNQNE